MGHWAARAWHVATQVAILYHNPVANVSKRMNDAKACPNTPQSHLTPQ